MSKNKTSTITRNPNQLVIERIPMTPETPAQAVAPVKNIYQRMNTVMQEVDYIQKRDSNNGLKYRYASHDAVTGLLHGPVTKAGILIIPEVESYAKEGDAFVLRLRVDFVNIDMPEDKISMKFAVPSASRMEISEKSFGATYSYACKYALLKAFMLETGDDADETSYLSAKEVGYIMQTLAGDMDRLQKILDFYRVQSLADIPSDRFPQIVKRIEAKKVEVPNETT